MKRFAVVIILFLCFACGRGVAEKPERFLSEDDMVNVLYDLALLQAINGASPAILDSAGVDAKTYIYKKYTLDSLSLVQNQKYYAADMENYQKIHSRVSERLKAIKAPLDSVAKKSLTPAAAKRVTRGGMVPTVE